MGLSLTQTIDDDEDVIIITHADEVLRVTLRSTKRGRKQIKVTFEGPRSFDIDRAKALKNREKKGSQ